PLRALSHTSRRSTTLLTLILIFTVAVIGSGGFTALGTEMKLVVLCVVFVRLMAEEEHRASPTHRIFHQTDLWNAEKPQTLFARRGLAEYQRSQAMKPLDDPVLKAPRCSRLKENCAPDTHSRCCDPCASCHCRFFNTICRCWRLGRPCQRKT
ncbi:hypothetical protein PGIGA_G00010570, partial [Pangasianodon gigas]|nr:hypothetical protein [Pangasianodon gigas]